MGVRLGITQPSDARADQEADGDGGEDCEASEHKGPRFVARSDRARQAGCDDRWYGGIWGKQLCRMFCGGRLALSEFDRSLADAGAFRGEAFEQDLIMVREGGGRQGKNFENAGKLRILGAAFEDRNDEDGTDAEAARDGRIDSRIEFGVDGKLRLTSFKTGSREAVASIERDAKIGSELAGGGAADHLSVAHERESSGNGVCGLDGVNDHFVEH